MYLFVDGGYLDGLLKAIAHDVFFDEVPAIDFGRILNGFDKGFYYNSLPAREHDESASDHELRVQPQRMLFDAIQSTACWHVVEGIVVGNGKKRRQKEVDVSIAVDMLTFAFQKTVGNMTFLAGDGDFVPLIKALVRQGTMVTLYCDTRLASQRLMRAADTVEAFDAFCVFALASPEFRSRHAAPPERQEGQRLPATIGQEYHVVASNQEDDLSLLLLHDKRGRYYTYRKGPRPDRYSVLIHSDAGLLKRYFASLYGDPGWVEKPEP